MANAFDLVIRGGTVYDGTGTEGRVADVAIRNGVIAAIGEVLGTATTELDATGQIVTPGFVDIHTHYDGQLTWDSRLSPSSWHGVTTAVTGNCGVGFAPCRPEDHDRLIKLMEGVEDIPGVVLADGLPWNWESFPEYLSAVEARPHDIDYAIQVPHAALRVYVMGERGANREPATPSEIDEMSRLAEDAVKAGAIGFSTSRTLNHRTSDGQPTPTLTAEADELVGIANGLGRAGQGVLQVVSDFIHKDDEFAMLRRMTAESGRPLSFTVAQAEQAPDSWKWLLSQIDAANEDGLEIRGQVCGRPVGILLGLDLTMTPFTTFPSFREIRSLPFEQKLERFRDPAFRKQLLSEEADVSHPFIKALRNNIGKMFLLGENPNYEPDPSQTLGALAEANGTTPDALAYDYFVETDGRGLIYFPFLNYAEYSLDPSLAMLRHPHTVPGLSDGGAHVGTICDASFPTTMIGFWTKERTRGDRLGLAEVIKMQTHDTARAVGLNDRGVLKVGFKADVNVIDYDALTLHAPEIAHDLPAGGKRLIQTASGYSATIVSGEIVYRNGEPTGALPGKLVRGEMAVPMAVAAE